MTSTHETPVSLFGHNKCGKITVKHWELDLFLILHFTYLGVYAPGHPPAYGPGSNNTYPGTREVHGDGDSGNPAAAGMGTVLTVIPWGRR